MINSIAMMENGKESQRPSQRLQMAEVIRQWVALLYDNNLTLSPSLDDNVEAFAFWAHYGNEEIHTAPNPFDHDVWMCEETPAPSTADRVETIEAKLAAIHADLTSIGARVGEIDKTAKSTEARLWVVLGAGEPKVSSQYNAASYKIVGGGG